ADAAGGAGPSGPRLANAHLRLLACRESGQAARSSRDSRARFQSQERRAGGAGMSFDLFTLLPAVHRTRDIELAQSQTLLTPQEIVELNTLEAPLSIDQQLRLDSLNAKTTRGPLHSLLLVIQEQLAIFAEDLDQLYDDQFIETCAQWVIPYIGDLIGY